MKPITASRLLSASTKEITYKGVAFGITDWRLRKAIYNGLTSINWKPVFDTAKSRRPMNSFGAILFRPTSFNYLDGGQEATLLPEFSLPTYEEETEAED